MIMPMHRALVTLTDINFVTYEAYHSAVFYVDGRMLNFCQALDSDLRRLKFGRIRT